MNLKMALWKLTWPLRARWQKGGEVGSYFPDFALNDLAGARHALLENPAKKLTVLWFTNLCEDCRNKIPLLEELRQEAGDRIRILAVSILKIDDPLPRQVGPSCSFPLLLDPEDIVSWRLGLPHPPNACPLHNLFFVSVSGRIVFRHHLSAMGPEKFRALWRSLLSEGQTSPELNAAGDKQ
ncbi:MAG: hypothetical protein A3G41_04425 [Elusimicrobia bacterium RIFCSPLOWO2_12_FULL_59_9]|nr:MAG: hypothetical protein A3G41_04425 [Elusimicrobia bacterium RIFCSPLOWO2_12_FULL_59_9]